MRVDAHAHAIQERWHPEAWWQAVSRRGAEVLGVPAALIRDTVTPALFDEDGTGQLGAMDTAGVDVAVMFGYDWSLETHLGPPEVGWREQNDWYADLAGRSDGRVRWGFAVDPRHEGALEAFEEAVRDRGAVCLKLHPSGGWAIDDPVARPFLEAAGELGVPVVFHVGPAPEPLDPRWAEPRLLDPVAAAFPDLPILAAHTGNELWRELLEVASRRPSVHCDLSGWQLRLHKSPDSLHAEVREVLDVLAADRVLWGTDAPYFRALVSDDDWVRAFTEAPPGTYTEGELEALLGGNAVRLFGLEG